MTTSTRYTISESAYTVISNGERNVWVQAPDRRYSLRVIFATSLPAANATDYQLFIPKKDWQWFPFLGLDRGDNVYVRLNEEDVPTVVEVRVSAR